MKYEKPLIQGQFIKRYKRFFADFQLSGKTEVAHVANTGSLKSCNQPGQPCWVSPATNPERKLRYTLEAIQVEGGAWVGVNTSYPNKLIAEAFENKIYPHWKDFDQFQAEVKINAETRLDAVLSNAKKKHYVEVKNVTLAENGVAKFPDAVTERGQKHLKELMKLVRAGHSCEIFFTVQRSDCDSFAPADEIDPEYGKLLREAHACGVIISAYVVDLSRDEIKLSTKKLKLEL